jgi:hypothetical protein
MAIYGRVPGRARLRGVGALVILLAIDPGVKECACAFFRDGALFMADFRRAPCRRAPWPGRTGVDVAIVERPEQDGRSFTARPKDLMNLAWAGAALAYSVGAPVTEYTPSQWKGQVPKPAQHKRLWERLSPDERAILGGAATEKAIHDAARKGALDRWKKPGASYYPRSFRAHNLLDAVALGRFHITGEKL